MRKVANSSCIKTSCYFFNFINSNNIDNLVVLTGDIHTSWANDLPGSGYSSSSGSGSVGVEFVTPSVTSPGADFGGGIGAAAIQTFNSHMKFVDLTEHGFYECKSDRR